MRVLVNPNNFAPMVRRDHAVVSLLSGEKYVLFFLFFFVFFFCFFFFFPQIFFGWSSRVGFWSLADSGRSFAACGGVAAGPPQTGYRQVEKQGLFSLLVCFFSFSHSFFFSGGGFRLDGQGCAAKGTRKGARGLEKSAAVSTRRKSVSQTTQSEHTPSSLPPSLLSPSHFFFFFFFPQDFDFPLPSHVRRLGLAHALSAKAAAGKLFLIGDAEQLSGKTRELTAAMERLGLRSVLFVEKGENGDDSGRPLAEKMVSPLARAAFNLPSADVIAARGLNVYDILRRDALAISVEALPYLENDLLKGETDFFLSFYLFIYFVFFLQMCNVRKERFFFVCCANLFFLQLISHPFKEIEPG